MDYEKSKEGLSGHAADKTGSGHKKAKLHTHEIKFRRGHAGGYVATHEMRDEQGRTPDHPNHQHEYPLSDEKEALAHFSQHMGEGTGPEAAATPEAGGAPQDPNEDAA